MLENFSQYLWTSVLNLSRDVVTILSGFSAADNTLGSITIVFGGLVPLAVEFHRVGTGHIIDNLFLHVAIRRLHVSALVVILRGHVDLIGGVTHPVLPSEASLHLVGFLQSLVMDGLYQVTHQLVHIKTYSLNIGLDDTSAVVEGLCHARFLVLSITRPLNIRLTLVLEYNLLHHPC